jgi:predicted nucleotide-binding protein (sugar kinase/HSP70/actin superfamily)
MDSKERKRKEAAVMVLKQASVIKTMALACAAFRNGTMKVVPLPEVSKRKLNQVS